jgi:hypothetical protein
MHELRARWRSIFVNGNTRYVLNRYETQPLHLLAVPNTGDAVSLHRKDLPLAFGIRAAMPLRSHSTILSKPLCLAMAGPTRVDPAGDHISNTDAAWQSQRVNEVPGTFLEIYVSVYTGIGETAG